MRRAPSAVDLGVKTIELIALQVLCLDHVIMLRREVNSREEAEAAASEADSETRRLIADRSYYSQTRTGTRTMNHRAFGILVAVVEVLALAACVVVGVWMGKYRGGFAWNENPKIQFNYHPLFMIIGMIFLYSNGMLVYRVFRTTRKLYMKVVHGAIHGGVLIISGVGLKAAFDSHNLATPNPIPNMYSLHSWLGLSAVILVGIQWLIGFSVFLLPFAKDRLRAFVKPVHAYIGAIILAFSVATCFAGITEKTLWSLPTYSQLPGEGVLVNCLGLLLAATMAVAIYVVTNENFRRQPLPTD